MLWVALGISIVFSVAVIRDVLRTPPIASAPSKPEVIDEPVKPTFDDAELARAAVELYAIRRRLDTALIRGALSRQADWLRHELAEEMRRIEILESRGAWDE
jgi:hypothetical protein